jgi:hypothetical protein
LGNFCAAGEVEEKKNQQNKNSTSERKFKPNKQSAELRKQTSHLLLLLRFCAPSLSVLYYLRQHRCFGKANKQINISLLYMCLFEKATHRARDNNTDFQKKKCI